MQQKRFYVFFNFCDYASCRASPGIAPADEITTSRAMKRIRTNRDQSNPPPIHNHKRRFGMCPPSLPEKTWQHQLCLSFWLAALALHLLLNAYNLLSTIVTTGSSRASPTPMGTHTFSGWQTTTPKLGPSKFILLPSGPPWVWDKNRMCQYESPMQLLGWGTS